MKKLLILFACILGAAGISSGNPTGEISGIVKDSVNGEPLWGASITLYAKGVFRGVVTDSAGKYVIKGLEAGVYDVSCSFIGYRKRTTREVQVSTGNITMLHFKLTQGSDSTDLPLITVWGDVVPLIEPDNPSVTRLTFKDLKFQSAPRGDMAALVVTMRSDIHQSDDGKELYFRGSRAGNVKYVFEGMTLIGSTSVPNGAVGEIAVYTGGVPSGYGDTIGGVVVITMKSFFDQYRW